MTESKLVLKDNSILYLVPVYIILLVVVWRFFQESVALGIAFSVFMFLFLLFFLKAMLIRITLGDDGIAGKKCIGGWSHPWSDIREWNAVRNPKGRRMILFKTYTDDKVYKLSAQFFYEDGYRQAKEFFDRHCGKATKINSRIWTDASEEE